MRTQLNNTEFKVFFRYPSKKRKQGSVTECMILAGKVGSTDEEKQQVGYGVTRRHSDDSPNHVTARTVALRKAIAHSNAFASAEDAVRFVCTLPLRINWESLGMTR